MYQMSHHILHFSVNMRTVNQCRLLSDAWLWKEKREDFSWSFLDIFLLTCGSLVAHGPLALGFLKNCCIMFTVNMG